VPDSHKRSTAPPLKNVITFTAMSQANEIILFTEIKNINEKSFKQAFDLYYPRLCFFADKMLHDFDLSRSVVQQVFVELWIKRERLVVQSLQSYLYQAVKNSALDVLKHKKVEHQYLQSLEKAEFAELNDQIVEAELDDRINRAIQNLPEKCREIFILCRFDELKYAEIAERLGISIKTVEMQISIALKKLRNELSDYQMIQLLSVFFQKKR
jgi:RNA polymerase sigma-70 factor (ECF subfamily)